MRAIQSLLGDMLLSIAGVALVAAGILLSMRKQALTALPLLLLGTVCLIVVGRGKLNELIFDTQGKVTIRFEPTEPNAAPNVEELKSKAVDAVRGEIGKPDAISGLPESVLNPFFDALRRLGFIPVLGLPGGPLRPGDIVDTSTGYTVVARQETAFPTLQVRTYPTTLPQFDLVDAKGRPVLHIACDNATRSDVSQGELRQHLYRDQELLLTQDTQVVAGVISCGTFKVTQEVRPLDIRGTIGTGRNDVQIAARLATPRLFRAPPSS